jgi:hypothetical protein
MSSKLQFQLFFGDYNVVYGPNGVDLSAFKCTTCGIDKPLDRSFGSILKFLERSFKVNTDTHVLTVNALVNWEVEGENWELQLIHDTDDWRIYMQAALERGWPLSILVKTQLREGYGAQHDVAEDIPSASTEAIGNEELVLEPEGVADEGERIPSIVDNMVAEEQEANEMEEHADSSDDEGYELPTEWKEQGFGTPVVEDISHQEWEYRGNEVVQGARYADIEALKDAVKLWSFSLRRPFKVVKSGSKEYDVKCMNDDCPWRVHAYKGRWKAYWTCSIVTAHTCHLPGVEKSHRNMSSLMVAKQVYGLIMDKLDYEPAMIVRHIEQKFQYTISYVKAWRAKQKVFEMRFGTYEASYDNLPSMLSCIVQRNPGSYYEPYLLPGPNPGQSILLRFFFCLGACVRAFQYCLPVLCIDGTFLTGKYKGQILTAIGVDCNNKIIPIAFGFVENENTESWFWFLERVKMYVVSGRPNVCLISDRHAGLLQAIKQLQSGKGSDPPIWHDVQNRWCIRHMGTNFYDHFKNKELMLLFKRLCV